MILSQLFAAFLPYLCLLLTIWFMITIRRRDAIFLNVVRASVVWALFVWSVSNILSWLSLITGMAIVIFWLLYLFLILAALWRQRCIWRLPQLKTHNYAILAIACVTLFLAIIYPPNNYDVMTYHMPRVAHWLQNHSMAPWPTSIDRQIGMAPFNAMIALQSYAPGRLDYFVNLGQWLAFLGCMLGARDITAFLGGGKRAQGFALVFVATMPTAIIQASNTESCLIVSFFLCAMAYMYLLWRKDGAAKTENMLLFGACLGLAILSKGSAYPIALPFVGLVAWYCLKSPKKLLLQGMIAGLLVVGLNLPHFARSMGGEGSIVAGSERNILLHPTPGTFVVSSLYNFLSNHPILLDFGGRELWKKFSSKMGVEQDDKNVLPWGGLDGAKDYYVPSDAIAPNPLQSVLVFFVAATTLLRRLRLPWHYGSAVLASFVFFCLLLTWHPWIARIQTSLFVLAAPACAILMNMIKTDWLYRGIVLFFYIVALFPLLLCVERPLVPGPNLNFYRQNVRHFLQHPREELFFNYYTDKMQEYIKAADAIAQRNPKNVGLRIGSNALEYPLWALLNNRMQEMPYIYHAINGQLYPGLVFEFMRHENEGQMPAFVWEIKNGAEIPVFPKEGRDD